MNNTIDVKQVEFSLLSLYSYIYMDKPSNHEEILEFVVKDIVECANDDWSYDNVAIGFRRWIESKSKNYFEIVKSGYDTKLQREEIQIHAGDNGNIFIMRDGDNLGFIVDVYGQNDNIGTMTIFEDDLIDDTDNVQE